MAAYHKSIEFVLITLTSNTEVAVNLTKGQNIDDCIPYMARNCNLTVASIVGRRYCEVYFKSGTPNQVAAIRDDGGGTVVIGVFVVEYDTSGDVSVEQGTFSGTGATDTEVISAVTIAKALVVHNYQIDASASSQAWSNGAVRVEFSTTTELTFTRVGTTGTMLGRWYVLSTTGSEFTVLHRQITIGSTAELTETTIAATVLADTFLLSSYSTVYTGDDILIGSLVVDLKDTTTVRSRRGFNDFGDDTPDGAAVGVLIVEVQVIECQANEFLVARYECDWGDDVAKAVAITEIDQDEAIIVAGGYQGTMSSAETSSGEGDGNNAYMSFTSDTEVTGTRGVNTDPDGTTMFEVVEFELAAAGVLNLVMAPYIPA